MATKKSWNKGMTKHDHPSIMAISKKLTGKKTNREPWNKGIKMWEGREHPRGTLNKPRKKESIEKFSKTMKQKYKNNPEMRKEKSEHFKKLWQNPEYRKKMIESRRGMTGKKHSEDSKRKMSETKKGRVPWNKGKSGIYSKETLKKMSEHKKGRKISEEHRNILIEANKGRKMTDYTRKRLNEGRKKRWANPKEKENRSKLTRELWANEEFRKSMTGKNHPMYGKKLPKEQIEKIRKARLKQIIPRKDTKIEVRLQNILNENNIKFITHKPITGQPDIFIEPNICVFADGCYWHECPYCGLNLPPNPGARQRDKRINISLQQDGYKVLRFWEHDIKKNIDDCFNKIIKYTS